MHYAGRGKNFGVVISLLACAGLSGCASLVRPKPADSQASDKPVATQAPVSMMQPMVERRDNIVATGYAVIAVQNHKSPPQQRLLAIRAKIDAYRGLAEQVYGIYLDANTTVAEMTVLSDTFRTKVEGVVYGARLSNITPISNDTYEVTLSLDSTAVNDLRALYLEAVAAKRR
jgi:hypothetical protein